MKKMMIVLLLTCFFVLQQMASGEGNTEIFSQLDKANNNWLQSFNKKQGEVFELYLEEAVLFPDKGDLIKGSNKIADYYKNNYQSISKITNINVNARFLEKINLVYEIGYFTTVSNDEYQYLVTWKKKNNAWVRELEMIGKKILNQTDSAEIDESRTDWIKFCNAHNAKILVEKLYKNNAYYYNRGRVLQGWDKINSEYSYMNNNNYSLYLQPKIVKVVQSDLAYEIGKCSGSYSGHYILRWEKEPTGVWKISLDSNY